MWNRTAIAKIDIDHKRLTAHGKKKPPLPWLISVSAMIDESNIPRFKQRLEIRYDHRPALRHGSDELGVRPFNRMGECELRGRPRGLNLVDATGVPLCLELGLPFLCRP